jgi:hypothetical protein
VPRKLDRVKKAFVVVLILAALLGLAAPGAHALGVYGIWWMPDEDNEDDGWGVGIKDQRPINRILSIDTRASYVSLSSSDTALIPIESTLLVRMGTLYGGIGAGYYFVTGDNRLKNEFGWYWLAGITMLPGPTQIFGEVKWQNLTADIDAPSGGSVDFDALAIHAGVTMPFPR